jgi:hypothetical protein
MHVLYWIVAALLALVYVYSGGLKLLRSKDALRPMMGWVDQVPLPLLRALGGLEVLGALGLVLPPLTGIAVALALASAVGLFVLQIGGVALHLARGEGRLIGFNIGLLVAAAAAAWSAAAAWL